MSRWAGKPIIVPICLLLGACGSEDQPVKTTGSADMADVHATAVGPVHIWRPQVSTTTTVAPTTQVVAPVRNLESAPANASSVECGGWRGLVASLWPADEVSRACRILMCESRGDPSARNPSGSSGLFQLMSLHTGRFEARGWSWSDWPDPVKNATVAHDLWLDSGWVPWVCS